MKRRVVIIGAGPAGLTAAYELLTRSDLQPIVLEKSAAMGGISRTVEYKGNRIDIGGHRFFSKSDRVMNWWLGHMPVESGGAGQTIAYHSRTRSIPAGVPTGNGPNTMLVRVRRSRIYFLRRFFDYPLRLSSATLRNLGLLRTLRIGASYLRAVLVPPRRIENLEQFFISRFGRELYRTFFKSYTEKVWGVPCERISAAWGAQRVRGLSISRALLHLVTSRIARPGGIRQKSTETSLIEQFLYPRLGPGQLWELVAEKVRGLGGEIRTEMEVVGLGTGADRIRSVRVRDRCGNISEIEGEYFFSTMPVRELVAALDASPPAEVRAISDGLLYRDFITVGLLVRRLRVSDAAADGRGNGSGNGLIRDNWIYIQEPEVMAGRLQIFNNWSPAMVRDPDTVWIGVEYFCSESDRMWHEPDAELVALAGRELDRIGILRAEDVLDGTVIRMPKTYPAYFGTYERFDELRRYLERYGNLFLIGRNGMHRYNNQDHSMLTAMTAVDNLIAGRTNQDNIWAVNTEEEYHEER